MQPRALLKFLRGDVEMSEEGGTKGEGGVEIPLPQFLAGAADEWKLFHRDPIIQKEEKILSLDDGLIAELDDIVIPEEYVTALQTGEDGKCLSAQELRIRYLNILLNLIKSPPED